MGFFGSPESRRDPGLFHGLIRPVPASPGPKLCTIWQPTKSRNAARFPVFYSGNKTTTLSSGRVSPCCAREEPSRPTPSSLAIPPPLAQAPPQRLAQAPPPVSIRESFTSSRIRPIIPTPRHPMASAPAPRLLHAGFPTPLPSRRSGEPWSRLCHLCAFC